MNSVCAMKRTFKTKHILLSLMAVQILVLVSIGSGVLQLLFSLVSYCEDHKQPLRSTWNTPSTNIRHVTQFNNTRPHIIFILADDLGYRDVGYHGSRIRTPNIDRLAMSGIRLENYYTQAVCSPTRGQLLTGRYQIHTGFQWVLWPASPRGLSLGETTIAEKLRETGYATHIVGKWHLGYFKNNYLPTNRGFDSFFGFLAGHGDHYTHRATFNKMEGYDLMENDKRADMSKYNGTYSTTLFTNKVKQIIQKHNPEKPLFIYLPYQAVHGPLQVPDKYIRMYKNPFVNETRETYAGMVTCMDQGIGQIVKSLKKKGMWNNTLLIFSSDNGGKYEAGASNFPLRGEKCDMWEGGIRVPGFVHSELINKEMAGTVSNELMHVTDWFPTLLRAAGGTINGTKPLDGYDQWETLMYGKPGPRTEILHDILPLNKRRIDTLYDNVLNSTFRASIRIGDWKLMKGHPGSTTPRRPDRNFTTNVWLYNIANDPEETTELSDLYPEKVQTMLQRIEYYRKGMVPCPYIRADRRADPRRRRGFWEPWL
ncbi:arylsulfatase J-like [Ruditapes philippinarum]|uniref:arylsulfatase J-like n=1 Tax=Ruditapes philippinarum TaxID=129788 RepID=UPI00295A5D36|nr:arylsulfatase J-like [Ruditapes philippinarum]